jgi:hypothetical protein
MAPLIVIYMQWDLNNGEHTDRKSKINPHEGNRTSGVFKDHTNFRMCRYVSQYALSKTQDFGPYNKH